MPVKAREVGSANLAIVVKLVWRERRIVDRAHPARMLVVDTVRSRGGRGKLGGATVVNVGG